ncbi:MAG TPA: hypothetical protein VHX68_07015 [Planctomycetaceae bacterium]|jgi:hypothetical protein|nr:hypothetical protein [Planctomycetaceae bacterium]
MRAIFWMTTVVLVLAGSLSAGGSSEVRGRVIDAQGKPVANVVVSYFRHADGPLNGAGARKRGGTRQSLIANYGQMFRNLCRGVRALQGRCRSKSRAHSIRIVRIQR